MSEQKIQKQNVGNAGEYYVASRLSALNFVVTITLGRTEKYDILALSPNGRLIKMSIKTSQVENAKDFPLSVKDESGEANDFYYSFVRLNKFIKEPDFWIVPSKVVCPLIKKAHAKWQITPGKNNKKHGISSVRIFPIEVSMGQIIFYPSNWDEEVKKYHNNLEQLL